MFSTAGARWKVALIVAAWSVSCSSESPNPDTGVGSGGAQGASRGSAGASGGAGQVGATGGAAGIASATPRGGNGSAAQSGSAAGATPKPVAGSGGSSGSAGSSVAPAKAGSGGQAAGSSGRGEGGAAGAAAVAGAGGSTSSDAGCVVAPITADMRSRYENMNNDYYKKFASANGIVVATGSGVDDEAIIRYCRLLGEMTSNEEVRAAITRDKMWFTMIADNEQLSSLPQINRDYGTSLNARARGLGGLTPTICAEDSIMCKPGDKWNGDCICPHETGHTLYSSGIAKVSALSSRLSTITKDARSSGRIANSYVWQDGNESGMMAWGVQVWYDCAINGTRGAYHPDINTRAELQKEMPEFYQFLSELLPADNKYKDCYAK